MDLSTVINSDQKEQIIQLLQTGKYNKHLYKIIPDSNKFVYYIEGVDYSLLKEDITSMYIRMATIVMHMPFTITESDTSINNVYVECRLLVEKQCTALGNIIFPTDHRSEKTNNIIELITAIDYSSATTVMFIRLLHQYRILLEVMDKYRTIFIQADHGSDLKSIQEHNLAIIYILEAINLFQADMQTIEYYYTVAFASKLVYSTQLLHHMITNPISNDEDTIISNIIKSGSMDLRPIIGRLTIHSNNWDDYRWKLMTTVPSYLEN